MGNCVFAKLVDGQLKKFSCKDVWENHCQWKTDFRRDNGVEVPSEDRSYIRYCQDIDNFLKNCKCYPDLESCEFCPKEEHEGNFCRCESRNMRIAKQLRMQKDNKGQGYESMHM